VINFRFEKFDALKARVSLLLVFAMLVAGCASKTISNASVVRRQLFPNGTYQHDVDLTVEKPILRAMHFHGVVKISDAEINLVALSPLSSTLFRISENRKTGQIDTEIYIESLKKLKSLMTDFYALIRFILTVPLDAEKDPDKHFEFRATTINEGPNRGLLDQLSIQTTAGEARVEFRSYDENQIPDLISVNNPKFKLMIKVSGYDI